MDLKKENNKRKHPTSNNPNKKFKYGNYNRYYGYRNSNKNDDIRIDLLQKDWFCAKSCLDIGCNVGHLTLWIAKNFQPETMRGVDIDFELIKAAKNNISNYIDIEPNIPLKDSSVTKDCSVTKNNCVTKGDGVVIDNCISKDNDVTKENSVTKDNGATINNAVSKDDGVTKDNRVTNGVGNTILHNVNVATSESTECSFPYNVKFVVENYVPSSDNLLKYVKCEYDTILCLSVTKWVQLNFGDDALKRMFKKICKQLRPGGKFILEPQPYVSYKKRKNLSDAIRHNYDNMKFMPDDYVGYLLSEDVGFTRVDKLLVRSHEKQGFTRPFFVLTKE